MRKFVFVLICCCLLFALFSVSSAEDSKKEVPDELQGTWIVQEMFGNYNPDIDVSSAKMLGANVEMIIKSDGRYFSVGLLGMTEKTDKESLIFVKDGLLFCPDTSRFIAWHINEDASVVTMTDSGETYILAIRPGTDISKAKIPSYPSIPSENDLAAENIPEEDTFLLEKASLSSEAIALSKELDDVFTNGKTVRLVPEELLTAEQKAYLHIIDISPDGKTILCKKRDEDRKWQMCLVRDGNVIPVKLNTDKGAGDPNGTFGYYTDSLVETLPAREGVSWSSDVSGS